MSKKFSNVEVNVVDCPDLREKPWTLAAPGMVYYNWQANLFKYLSQQEGTKEKCNTLPLNLVG